MRPAKLALPAAPLLDSYPRWSGSGVVQVSEASRRSPYCSLRPNGWGCTTSVEQAYESVQVAAGIGRPTEVFSALVDTSVLVPSLTRDVLLQHPAAGGVPPAVERHDHRRAGGAVDRILTGRGIHVIERPAHLERLVATTGEAFPDGRVAFPIAAISRCTRPT